MFNKKGILFLILFVFMSSFANSKDLENIIYMDLKDGRVEIEMRPDVAPNHVARIKDLVRKKFYDGILFHRVIDGFMAQAGDPTGTGAGGSDKPDLKAEFNKLPHVRGAVSMARTSDPDSANSQFFIMLKDNDYLDGKYTVWGKVTKGIEYIDMIKKGSESDNGKVSNPDKIISMKVASDLAE